jgi:hypothetical protein
VDARVVAAEIKRCFDEYRHLADGAGDTLQTFSAVARYAEADRWLELLPSDARGDHRQADLPPRPGPAALSEAASGLSERIAQNLETLSYGTRFQYEEILLLLTHAIEIELVYNFLRDVIDVSACENALADLEAGLVQVRSSKESAAACDSAVNQIQRKHRLPSRLLAARN